VFQGAVSVVMCFWALSLIMFEGAVSSYVAGTVSVVICFRTLSVVMCLRALCQKLSERWPEPYGYSNDFLYYEINMMDINFLRRSREESKYFFPHGHPGNAAFAGHHSEGS
jgi:hypothetical protein